ncbi:hypothetical protein ACFIO0_15380 [Pseudosulfitobacter sp. SM2401]
MLLKRYARIAFNSPRAAFERLFDFFTALGPRKPEPVSSVDSALRVLEENRSLELKTELQSALAKLKTADTDGAQSVLVGLLDAVDRRSDEWIHRRWNKEIEDQAGALDLLQLSADDFYAHLLKFMLDALNRAHVEHTPYAHFVIDPVFDAQTYICLLLSSPHITHLKPIPSPEYFQNGRYQRYQTTISPNAFDTAHRRVGFVWLTMDRVMQSPQIIALLFSKLGMTPPDKCKAHTRIQLDRAGTRIRPHLDGENGGLVTFQMYFPLDKSNFDTGTELFEKHGDQFETVKKMNYKPNLAYAFQIGNDSWHGANEPMPQLSEGRLSFLTRYRVDT